jgi:glyoxylase-like metal-dependent hydrolase (beta-lactamase superfamily II)
MPAIQQISPRIYWLPPDKPDRPSLLAVCGSRCTLMLDAGASAAHAQIFLQALAQQGQAVPQMIALTHWHWDHVFGAAHLPGVLIAQQATAAHLRQMQAYAWDDAALDERVMRGEEIVFCADNIKLELPSPRQVTIRQADIVFDSQLTLDLGGLTCQLEHVGGDHAPDSVVMFIPEEGVLFLGDCLYPAIYAPVYHYTPACSLPLIERLLRYDATLYIEGHGDDLLRREEFVALMNKMRLAADLLREHGADVAMMQAAAEQAGVVVDEDLQAILADFAAGAEQKSTC